MALFGGEGFWYGIARGRCVQFMPPVAMHVQALGAEALPRSHISSHALARCGMHVQAKRAGQHRDTAQPFHVQSSFDSALQKSAVQDACHPLPLTLQALCSSSSAVRHHQAPLQLSTKLQRQGHKLASVIDCKSLHCSVISQPCMPCESAARHSQMHVPLQVQCRLRDSLCNHPSQLHA